MFQFLIPSKILVISDRLFSQPYFNSATPKEQVQFTKRPSMTRVNIAFYWNKITQGKSKNEGWYLFN